MKHNRPAPPDVIEEQWEYDAQPVNSQKLAHPDTLGWLNGMGQRGWELVSITPLSLPGVNRIAGITSDVVYTFKRRRVAGDTGPRR
jgi:hypothetical protein